MILKVGYACINESLKPKTFNSCRLKSIETNGIEYLRKKIIYNIAFVLEILNWNVAHGIYMYRVSSDLFPLITHPVVLNRFEWRWYNDIEILTLLDEIKAFVEKHAIRISMHPDQFTVINSNRSDVVKASIEYLEFHAKLLSAMGGSDMIIHVGGVYGEKESAINRFVQTYNALSDEIKTYLRLENDDKSYAINEVLYISDLTGIPVVFDYHHHRCLLGTPVSQNTLNRIHATWIGKIPKIHMSSGKLNSRDKSHHEYISHQDSLAIFDLYRNFDVDIMVEAKKKELAALELLKVFKTIE